MDAIRAHPGLTRYRLVILLDVDEHELDRAMIALAHEGRLNGRKRRASIRWYTPEAPTDQEPSTSTIRPGMRAWEALVIASQHPDGVMPADVAACSRMTAGYAYKMLLRLQTAQLVTRCRDGRRWTVNQKGGELLTKEEA